MRSAYASLILSVIALGTLGGSTVQADAPAPAPVLVAPAPPTADATAEEAASIAFEENAPRVSCDSPDVSGVVIGPNDYCTLDADGSVSVTLVGDDGSE